MNKPETLLRTITEKNNIVFFTHSCFSQWYGGFEGQDSTFTMDSSEISTYQMGEITFNCAEQAMMYGKALLFEDLETAKKIMQTKSPAEQKALGRTIANFDSEEWDKRKWSLLGQINMEKFIQHPEFLEVLKKYSHQIICEASPWDSIWGIGMSVDDDGVEDVKNWKGQNLLGKVLMTVRDNVDSYNASLDDEY
jgi:ribA/ribD-fused uncharacterized protein